MNITPQHTTVADATQEVTLRTLASDVASLEHGSQTPEAERLTARFTPLADTAATSSGHNSSLSHVIIAILIVLLIGAAVYFFVYPHLQGGVTPTVI